MTHVALTSLWTSPPPKPRLWAETPQPQEERASVKSGYVVLEVGDVLDNVTARDQVLAALQKTDSEWRSARSLARDLGLTESRVRRALDSLGDEVRQPIAARPSERNLYRAASRGLAPRERLRYILLVFAQQGR